MCFFFLMRLRRFLISEPMAEPKLAAGAHNLHIGANGASGARSAPGTVLGTVGGGVTAARGPLESQVEVRNLAPEQPQRLGAEHKG